MTASPPAFAATPPAGTITGTVTDAGTSAGIGDVCAFVSRRDADAPSESTRTGADGTWEVAGLEPGYYSVSFSDCATDRSSTYLYEEYGEDAYGQRALVELLPEAGVAGIDAALSTSGSSSEVRSSITGTVTLPDAYEGEVCVEATPTGFESSLQRFRMSVTSSATAVGYDLSVEAGEYYLTVSDCDAVTYRAAYTTSTATSTTTDLSAATLLQVADSDIVGLDMTMIEGVPFSGTVTAPDQTPVAGLCVMVTPTALRSYYWTYDETDASGAFTKAGFEGEHRLAIRDCQAPRGYLPSSQPVTLPADGPVDLTVELGGVLAGAISRQDGQPVSWWCADMRQNEQPYFSAYTSGSEATYHAGPAPEGTFAFEVSECSNFTFAAPYRDQVTFVDSDGDGVADDQTLDVVLPEGGALRWDRRADRACRMIHDGNDGLWIGTNLLHTGEELTNGLAPGTYDVTLSDCDWQGGASETWTGIQVVAGQILDLDTLSSTPTGPTAGDVTGRLVNSNGVSPLADVPVQLCHDTDGYCRYVNSAADGIFTVEGLPVGDYTMTVYIPGQTPDTRSVTVDGDVPLGDLEFALPIGEVTGSVQTDAAAPVEDAYVSLCGDTDCWSTLTSSTGEFDFSSLADGVYSLNVWPSGGFTSHSETVEVVDGGAVDTTVTVYPPVPLPTDFEMNSTTEGSVPRTVVNEPNTLKIPETCADPVTFQVRQNGQAVEFDQGDQKGITEGTATKQDDGTYTAEFTLLYAGAAEVVVDGGEACQVSFSIYIDPSGYVRDQNGDPIEGATVTLLRSDIESGPYAVVPDGSNVMSPANRSNPDTTDATGHFGWDVTAGWYQVQASAPGCVDPVNGDATVESRRMQIPPQVTDLDIRLSCSAPSGGGGAGGGGGVSAGGNRHGDGSPDASDPVHVEAAVPNGGTATIEVVEGDTVATSGGSIRLGRQVKVTAPDATAADPLELTFVLDRSLLWPGITPTSVGVERNGVLVADCDADATGASPDPCVASRSMADGDLTLVVRTSKASTWSFLVDAAACTGSERAGFDDVSADDVHATSIGCVAALKVALGTGDGEFDPSGSVTRGQMASFILRALEAVGLDVPAGTDRFTDDDGTTHEAAINALAEAGIVSGTSATSYAPDEPVSRAQTAALVVRAAEYAVGHDLASGADRFSDDDGTTHEAAIDRAAHAGLVLGVSADRFDPSASVTRRQMASFLVHLLDLTVSQMLMS